MRRSISNIFARRIIYVTLGVGGAEDKEARRKMIEKSLSAFIRFIWRVAESVTVEPVLVLFSLSQGIYMITSQTVYIDKGGLF